MNQNKGNQSRLCKILAFVCVSRISYLLVHLLATEITVSCSTLSNNWATKSFAPYSYVKKMLKRLSLTWHRGLERCPDVKVYTLLSSCLQVFVVEVTERTWNINGKWLTKSVSLFPRSASSTSGTPVQYFTSLMKAIFKSAFARTAASAGTSSSTMSNADLQPLSTPSCPEAWVQTIPSTPRDASRAFAKPGFPRVWFAWGCRWRTARHFPLPRYRTTCSLTIVTARYLSERFHRRNKVSSSKIHSYRLFRYHFVVFVYHWLRRLEICLGWV